jgi:hypothetical protein
LAKQNERKGKLRWLAWTGFIILLLVVGFGPLAMLISFTWNENNNLGGFWERIRGDNRGHEQLTDPVLDDIPLEPYMVQYLYRYCSHSEVYQPGNIPLEYPTPPRAMAEIAIALHNSNLTIENLMDELKNPQGWYLADVREGCGRSFFMLTYLADFCPQCEEQYYLGIFNEKIAVYQGCPPDGKVIEVTEISVKEIDRQDLEKGVIFKTEEEKERHLETYSS